MKRAPWRLRAAVALFSLAAAPVHAQPVDPLAPLDFLVGHWRADASPNQDAPNRGGTSDIARDLQGTILVRRDRTLLKGGGTLDMTMIVYPEAGKLRADFFDSEKHVIHYAVSALEAGRRVQFTSEDPAEAPIFRITYDAPDAKTLMIRFEIAPPGPQRTFKIYAEGPMVRQ